MFNLVRKGHDFNKQKVERFVIIHFQILQLQYDIIEYHTELNLFLTIELEIWKSRTEYQTFTPNFG